MRPLIASLLMALALPAGAQDFIHPGILLDQGQIQTTVAAIARQEPVVMDALAALQADPRADLAYRATPWRQVECGEASNPDRGCRDEIRDAQAAYAHALLWVYLQDTRHADTSIEIMQAWMHTLSGNHTLSNAPLQAAWAAQLWTRSAELLRHTGSSWSPSDAQRFGAWLLDQYLPDIERVTPCHYGNWHASTIEARANIGIYNDRRDLYADALADWQIRLPAFVYLSSDGLLPVPPADCTRPPNNDVVQYWQGQLQFADGLAQETCRDLEHTAYGLAAFINLAQTDAIQGGQLYLQNSERLIAAMEFHSDMASRAEVPAWLCQGRLQGNLAGTFELGYAHYFRAGRDLPHTRDWLRRHRPSQGQFHYLWETLTHGVSPLEDAGRR